MEEMNGYASGEVPMIGDRVIWTDGRGGEVYNVQLNPGNSPGRAQVSVQFDNGSSVGNAIAGEFTLVNRKA